MSVRKRVAPREASFIEVARPIPLAAPVMKITLSWNGLLMVCLGVVGRYLADSPRTTQVENGGNGNLFSLLTELAHGLYQQR